MGLDRRWLPLQYVLEVGDGSRIVLELDASETPVDPSSGIVEAMVHRPGKVVDAHADDPPASVRSSPGPHA